MEANSVNTGSGSESTQTTEEDGRVGERVLTSILSLIHLKKRED